MAESLRLTSPRYPLVCLSTANLSSKSLQRLKVAQIEPHPVSDRFSVPDGASSYNDVARWKHTFYKLEAFSLIAYEKIVFLDSDMLINRNLDHLFEYEHMSAAVNYGRVKPYEHLSFPNTGVMVIKPLPELGKEIFSTWQTVARQTPSFSDQDLIHMYYQDHIMDTQRSWELSVTYNACSFLLDRIAVKHGLNAAFDKPNEKTIAVVHFTTANKPWLTSVSFRGQLLIRKVLRGKLLEVRAYLKFYRLLGKVRKATHMV